MTETPAPGATESPQQLRWRSLVAFCTLGLEDSCRRIRARAGPWLNGCPKIEAKNLVAAKGPRLHPSRMPEAGARGAKVHLPNRRLVRHEGQISILELATAAFELGATTDPRPVPAS